MAQEELTGLGGKRRGRGEDWAPAQLIRRGHRAVQQHPVWRNDMVGRYYIDVAVKYVAIELYSAPAPPRPPATATRHHVTAAGTNPAQPRHPPDPPTTSPRRPDQRVPPSRLTAGSAFSSGTGDFGTHRSPRSAECAGLHANVQVHGDHDRRRDERAMVCCRGRCPTCSTVS